MAPACRIVPLAGRCSAPKFARMSDRPGAACAPGRFTGDAGPAQRRSLPSLIQHARSSIIPQALVSTNHRRSSARFKERIRGARSCARRCPGSCGNPDPASRLRGRSMEPRSGRCSARGSEKDSAQLPQSAHFADFPNLTQTAAKGLPKSPISATMEGEDQASAGSPRVTSPGRFSAARGSIPLVARTRQRHGKVRLPHAPRQRGYFAT